jgi:predicted RNA-binding Zn ribbon-like protein
MVIVPVTTDIQPSSALPPEDLLVDFLNTVDVDLGTDVLASEVEFREWARSHGVEAGDLDEARDIRTALRNLVCGESCTLPEVTLRTVATPHGVLLEGDTAAASAVAIATVLTIQGRMGRVKLCPTDDCRWAFYDRSRNSSRTWCTMAVCGNREKARTFRGKADALGESESA